MAEESLPFHESSRCQCSFTNFRIGTVFNPGKVTNSSLDRSSVDHEVSGEGLRGAIKNGDTAVAKQLLSQGVKPNYHDKQGSSLLHLEAVFNQTEIAFTLMYHGASLNCKNLLGKMIPTPSVVQFNAFIREYFVPCSYLFQRQYEIKVKELDCTPATLQYKMKKKTEESK
ncbi:Ankyrin repeat family protein [Forsythia ovata]|uniref:Ankyrin repeat family protein n=1 Tax=Forsythia ovata TaxID=205694 RepID=A0ABD1WVV6_9LAMI